MLRIKVTSIPSNGYNCEVNIKYLMQQEPDHVAKLLSIQMQLSFRINAFYSSVLSSS